jgi:hypothetical protein
MQLRPKTVENWRKGLGMSICLPAGEICRKWLELANAPAARGK